MRFQIQDANDDHTGQCGREGPAPCRSIVDLFALSSQIGEDSLFQSRARFSNGIFRQRCVEFAVECIRFPGLALAILVLVCHVYICP
jgi:hypothetical protein